MLERTIVKYIPVQAVQAIVGFGAIAVFSRLLSPEEYGRYALILAAMALLNIVTFLWLDAAVARFHARAERFGSIPHHLKTAYGLYAVAALLAGGLGAGVIALVPLDANYKAAAGFALVHMLARGALQIGLETYRAGGEVRRYSINEIAALLGGFGFGAVLVLVTELGAAGVFAGMAAALLVVTLADLPAMLSRARGGRGKPRRTRLYAGYGAGVSASVIFEHLLSVGDRFLIAAFLGAGAVGVYAAGYGLGDRLIDILFVWLSVAIWPMTIRALEREGEAAAREVARRAAAIMAAVTLPAAVGLILVAEPLTTLMIGGAMRAEAALILPWIAGAALLRGMMTYYFHEAFTLKRRPGLMAALMAAAALLNLLLNLVLIPRFGIYGAAAATVIAYAAALLSCALVSRSIFPLPLPWLEWAKAGLATAAMAGFVWLLPDLQPAFADLLMKAGAGASVYAALALALNLAGCRDGLGLLTAKRVAG